MKTISKVFDNTISILLGLSLLITWLAGIVLAKGWISTIIAIFPFYAWYLVVEKAMQMLGIV